VQIAPAPVASKASAALQQAAVYQPVLVAHSLRLNSIPTAADLATTASTHPALGWMSQVQLAPLPRSTPAEDFIFQAPTTLRSDQNVFGTRLLPVEQAAYQFQR